MPGHTTSACSQCRQTRFKVMLCLWYRTSACVYTNASMQQSASSAKHGRPVCPEKRVLVLDTILQAESSERLLNAAGIAAKQSFTDKDIIDFLTNVE